MYAAFAKKAKDLTAKRDAATGPARMEYIQKLQLMRNTGIPLNEAYTETKQKYKAWEEDHPIRPPTVSKLSSLQADLARTKKALRRFGSTL